MPCMSDPSYGPSAMCIEYGRLMLLHEELRTRVHVNTANPLWRGENVTLAREEVREKADALTRVLCQKLSKMSSFDLQSHSLELQMWWREHQKLDARRKAEEEKRARIEKLKAIALAKLTPDERKLLGLSDS